MSLAHECGRAPQTLCLFLDGRGLFRSETEGLREIVVSRRGLGHWIRFPLAHPHFATLHVTIVNPKIDFKNHQFVRSPECSQSRGFGRFSESEDTAAPLWSANNTRARSPISSRHRCLTLDARLLLGRSLDGRSCLPADDADLDLVLAQLQVKATSPPSLKSDQFLARVHRSCLRGVATCSGNRF